MLPRNLPSDISQKRLIKAFRKVGFIADYTGGKGGHCKMICPKTNKFIIIQSHIYKQVLRDKLEQAEILGYDASEIMSKY